MIPTNRTVFRTTILLLLLLTGSLSAATPPTYHYLSRIVEDFEATAGEAKGVIFFVENNGSSIVSLEVTLPYNPSGYFSIGTLNSTADILPGTTRIFDLFFLSPEVGDFSALLHVTDGTLTDTLTVRTTVLPGQGDFSVFPLRNYLSTYTNTAVQIPISVMNLTNADLTVQTAMYANTAFSLSGTGSITLPPYGSQTLLINFTSAAEGDFEGRLTVTNGSYSLEALFTVQVKVRKYAYVIDPIFTDRVATAGKPSTHRISVENPGSAPAALQVALNGSSVFTLDPADQSFTLAPRNGKDLHIGILAPAEGSYATLLTVSDGAITDSLILTATVHPAPNRFTLRMRSGETKENQPGTTQVEIQNHTSSGMDVSLTFAGDGHFSYSGANPVSIDADSRESIDVDFAAAAPGFYTAMLYATDGILADSTEIRMAVRDLPDFFTLPNLPMSTLTFETERDSTMTQLVDVENVSGDTLTVFIELYYGDEGFSVDRDHLLLDAGQTASFAVSYTNDTNRMRSDRIYLTGGTQKQQIILSGHIPYYNEIDGFGVGRTVSFFSMDTSEQDCEDLFLRNNSQENVMVISAVLSGFSSSFSMVNRPFPIILRPRDRDRFNLCYQPSLHGVKEYEILTVTFDNPASNPRVQTVNVNLYGESYRLPSMTVADGMGSVAVPIGGQGATTVTLQNFLPFDATFDTAVWVHGNENAIFSLTTSLPLTITAADPALPGSGLVDITVQYAPTAQSSTVGTDEIGFLELKSTNTNPIYVARVAIIGTPLPHSSPASQLLLFPRDMRAPEIDLGDVSLNDTRSLQFVNNLQVAVTISDFELGGSHFEIINSGDFPMDLEPMGTMTLDLRCIAATDKRVTENLIQHGSHEALSSGYALLSGSGTLGIDDPIASPQDIRLSISPNPSAGAVTVRLSSPLRHASIAVVDMLGRIVAQDVVEELRSWTWNGLHDGSPVPPGLYSVFIRGRDADGHSTGVMNSMVVVR